MQSEGSVGCWSNPLNCFNERKQSNLSCNMLYYTNANWQLQYQLLKPIVQIMQICEALKTRGAHLYTYIYIYIYSIHVCSDFFWWYVVQCVHLPFHSAIEALKLRTRCATLPVSRFSFARVTVTIPHPTRIWSTGFGKPGFWRFQRWHPPI